MPLRYAEPPDDLPAGDGEEFRGDEVLVAWTDFRTYDWRITTRTSQDCGRTYADEVEAKRRQRALRLLLGQDRDRGEQGVKAFSRLHSADEE